MSHESSNFVRVAKMIMIDIIDAKPILFVKCSPKNSTFIMASVAAGQSRGSGANMGRGTTRLDLLNSPSASVADSDGRLAFRRPVCRRFAPVSAPRADNAL